MATYQTLPWDHRGWHAGGSANNTHIGFEICEDALMLRTLDFIEVHSEEKMTVVFQSGIRISVK